jgi:NADH:ubiquinone oxidoreductase subunit H
MVLILFILIGIAFITLYERHLLSLRQNRMGPKKTSLMGVLQAIFDGLKLFKKELLFPIISFSYFFFIIPFFSFLLILLD